MPNKLDIAPSPYDTNDFTWKSWFLKSSKALQTQLNAFISVKDYGAKGDGVTDDSLAIISAVVNGGSIFFPAGTYRITDTIVITQTRTVLHGEMSIILLDEVTGLKPAFQIGAGVSGTFGVRVEQLAFVRQQAATAGGMVYINYAAGTVIKECTVAGQNLCWQGIRVNRGIDTWVVNCDIESCLSDGIYAFGADATAQATNLHVFDNLIQHNAGDGIRCQDWVIGSSIYRNTMFANGGSGLRLLPTDPAHTGGDFEVSQNNIDSNTAFGFYTNIYGNIRVNDNWFSNNTGIALKIDTADNVVGTGNLMYGSAADLVNFNGVGMIWNGNYMLGGLHGITLGSTAVNCTITGNNIKNMTVGIDKSAGPDAITITGNMLKSNGTNISAGGTNVVSTGNNLL